MTSTISTTTQWTCDQGSETASTSGSRIPAGWGHYDITRTSQGGIVMVSSFDLCPTHLAAFEALVPVPFTNPAVP